MKMILVVLVFTGLLPVEGGDGNSPGGKRKSSEGISSSSSRRRLSAPVSRSGGDAASTASSIPPPGSEIIVVSDPEDEDDDRALAYEPWHRYASSARDRARLARMSSFDREVEIARRWEGAIVQLQRVELGVIEESELTSFDRIVRRERDGGADVRLGRATPTSRVSSRRLRRPRRSSTSSDEGGVIKREMEDVGASPPPTCLQSAMGSPLSPFSNFAATLGTAPASPLSPTYEDEPLVSVPTQFEATTMSSTSTSTPAPSLSAPRGMVPISNPSPTPVRPSLSIPLPPSSLLSPRDLEGASPSLIPPVRESSTSNRRSSTSAEIPLFSDDETSSRLGRVSSRMGQSPSSIHHGNDGEREPRRERIWFSGWSPIGGSSVPSETSEEPLTHRLSSILPQEDSSRSMPPPGSPRPRTQVSGVPSGRPSTPADLLRGLPALRPSPCQPSNPSSPLVRRSAPRPSPRRVLVSQSPPRHTPVPPSARRSSAPQSTSGRLPDPAPTERRLSVSSMGSDVSGFTSGIPMSASPASPTSAGRVVGSLRLPPVRPRAEDPQIADTYRELVSELLYSPHVPCSEQSPDQDPDSGPDDSDGLFSEAILHLEQYRPRPFSRGGVSRGGLSGPIPRNSRMMGITHIPTRSWEVVPRGVVSEWFPRLPLTTGSGGCLACEAEMAVTAARRNRRNEWYAQYAERNDRTYTSSLGCLPLLDWNESRLRCRHPLVNHSCACSAPVSFPVVMFTTQGRAQSLLGVRSYGVQFRLHMHLLAPGISMSWTAAGSFSGVFPIFGALRRYWGRFVLIRGGYTLMGGPPRSNRVPRITHSFSIFVHSRRARVLRYAPIEVFGHIGYGPRDDVFLHGASLQWDGNGGATGGDRLRYPQEITLDQMRRAFRARVSPHSYARQVEEDWEISLPERTIETQAPEGSESEQEHDLLRDEFITTPSPRGRDRP